MTAKKPADKSKAYRQKFHDTKKWACKMRRKGKISKGDLLKLKGYKKEALAVAESKRSLLTDDLDFSRFQEQQAEDSLFEKFGMESKILPDLSKKPKVEEDSSDEDENLESTYFKTQSKISNAQKTHVKSLLPIKTSSGQILRVAKEIKQEEEKNEELEDELSQRSTQSFEDQNKLDAALDDQPQLSVPEMFASRVDLLNKYKRQIANCCSMLTENPQENVAKLKVLLHLAKGFGVEQLVQLTVEKLAVASLLEVFLDIIPTYYIRPWTEEEEKQKMKKETRKLHNYEQALLKCYEKFLSHLRKLSTPSKAKNLPTNVSASFRLLATKAACSLLSSNFDFNFRKELLQCVIPLMNDNQKKIRNLTREAVKLVFKADILGEASLEIVRAICHFAKNHAGKTRPETIETFLCLKINAVEKPEEKVRTRKDILSRKRKIKMMSRREKKMFKRLKKLDDELEELDAEEKEGSVLKNHTQIMNHIFALYFRLLKRHSGTGASWAQMGPVLEGLSKFAHLINVEFFDDLIHCLLRVVEQENVRIIDALHCVRTAFVILSGEGQALNIDPYGFYRYVYGALLKIAKEKNKGIRHKQLCLCIQCIDFMLCKRRKQVNFARVAAFVKRLASILSSLDPLETTSVLLSIRSLFLAHPKLECLIDIEGTDVGGGFYSANIDDPDHCNAQSTSIIDELQQCITTCDKTNKDLCRHLLNGLSDRGVCSIHSNLMCQPPWSQLEHTA